MLPTRKAWSRTRASGLLKTEDSGPARLVWEHKGYVSSRGYYSVDHYNPRLESLFNFRFTGPRAGSEWHRDIVSDYANILQSKGRWVTVDTGTVESQLPDISVWAPHSPIEWRSEGAIEVEMEASRKSDEAILRNLRKNERKGEPVRFVVMSEKDYERIHSLIEKATGAVPMRVENYPGQLNHPIEVEVVDPLSGHLYHDFLQTDKVLGAKEATERSTFMHPRLLTPQEEAKERRNRGETELPRWSERARNLLKQRNDEVLTGLRRETFLREDFEEDEI